MVKEFCRTYFAQLHEVLGSLDLDAVDQLIAWLLQAHRTGHQVFVFGNGGSAAVASHFVCDINKGVSQPPQRGFRVISLNDNIPIMLAYANDYSYDEVFVGQLQNFVDRDDLVIGISGRGNSPNVIKAIRYAKDVGARTVGLTGFDGGQLGQLADLAVVAPVDDMQKVEDVHNIMTHLVMRVLRERLAAESAKG